MTKISFQRSVYVQLFCIKKVMHTQVPAIGFCGVFFKRTHDDWKLMSQKLLSSRS